MDVLAPDVVLITDGGGVKQAALRPIHGADKVLRLLAGGARPGDRERPASSRRWSTAPPALRLLLDDELDTIATMRVDDGKVTGLYFVRNPHKLGPAWTRRSPLTRVTPALESAPARTDRWSAQRQGSARGAESAEKPQTLEPAPVSTGEGSHGR